jgi:hypothetical protein
MTSPDQRSAQALIRPPGFDAGRPVPSDLDAGGGVKVITFLPSIVGWQRGCHRAAYELMIEQIAGMRKARDKAALIAGRVEPAFAGEGFEGDRGVFSAIESDIALADQTKVELGPLFEQASRERRSAPYCFGLSLIAISQPDNATPPKIRMSSPAFLAPCIACSNEHKLRATAIIMATPRRSIKAITSVILLMVVSLSAHGDGRSPIDISP